MIRQTKKFFTRFGRDEDGQIMIEFVILVPLIFTIFLTALELGIFSMRQMWLDRGLDIAMREVRLNTEDPPQHDELKTIICEQAHFLPKCDERLRLEMTPMDPTNFVGLSQEIDCLDSSEPVNPDYEPNYEVGSGHQLMMIRACYIFDPVFPMTGLGYEFNNDVNLPRMTAMSAFVQEPEE